MQKYIDCIYRIQNLLFAITAFKDCISAPRLATSGATSGTSATAAILETMKERTEEGLTFYLEEVEEEEVVVLQVVLLEGLGEVPDVVVDDDDY